MPRAKAAPATRSYPSREGKRAATVYLDRADYRGLRVLAALADKTLQDIIVEALRAHLAANREALSKLR